MTSMNTESIVRELRFRIDEELRNKVPKNSILVPISTLKEIIDKLEQHSKFKLEIITALEENSRWTMYKIKDEV